METDTIYSRGRLYPWIVTRDSRTHAGGQFGVMADSADHACQYITATKWIARTSLTAEPAFEQSPMTISEWLDEPTSQEWEDETYMVHRGHTEMHGLPIFTVNRFDNPLHKQILDSKKKVIDLLGAERSGKAS